MAGDAASLVRDADRDRYIATLYAPDDTRDALYALYAFDAETARVRERISEPLPGEIRLQWWRDAIAAPGSGAGHPLAESLERAVARHDLPRPALDALAAARIFDLYDDPMPDRATLEGYLGETEGAMIQLASLVLAAVAAARFGALAGHAGCARGIARLMAALPLHAARGQCFVPPEMMAATGTSVADLRKGGARARPLLTAMAALAREHLAAFEAGAGELPAELRPAYLPLATVGVTIDRLERGMPAMSEMRRQWLIFSRARRGWR